MIGHWQLHLVATVAAVWIALAADLTAANAADSAVAPELLCRLPAEVRSVLGDRHYNAPELREHCEEDRRILVRSRYGCYPHTDAGVEVRRIFGLWAAWSMHRDERREWVDNALLLDDLLGDPTDQELRDDATWARWLKSAEDEGQPA